MIAQYIFNSEREFQFDSLLLDAWPILFAKKPSSKQPLPKSAGNGAEDSGSYHKRYQFGTFSTIRDSTAKTSAQTSAVGEIRLDSRFLVTYRDFGVIFGNLPWLLKCLFLRHFTIINHFNVLFSFQLIIIVCSNFAWVSKICSIMWHLNLFLYSWC